jgi:DNA-directed RNA polymerase specialized sigma24 family protein
MSFALNMGDLPIGHASPAVAVNAGDFAEPSAASAFQTLLNRMRQEGGKVEERYESLRRRLIVFFRLHVPADAEALTDRALDRVGCKLMQGTEIENLLQFTLGVSRMMLVEYRSQRSREQRAQEGYAGMIEQPATPPDIGEWEEDEARLQERVRQLRDCLARLGEQATQVILVYYDSDGRERISRRQRLAAELGLSLNALRNRALRLRGMLERCLATSTCPRRDGTALIDTSVTATDDVCRLVNHDRCDHLMTCFASPFST